MDTLYFEMAGFLIRIRLYKSVWPFFTEKSFRDRLMVLYGGFLVNSIPEKEPDFTIDFVYSQLPEVFIRVREKKTYMIFYEEIQRRRIRTFYHISDAQFILILRRVIQKLLASKGGVMIHASGVLIKNKAYIFTGSSGAGKSTAMQFLASKYTAIADDSVIIKRESGEFFLYQTPFKEAQEWVIKKLGKYQLGGIFALEKSLIDRIEINNDTEAFVSLLMEQFFTEAEDADVQVKEVLSLAAKFNRFYSLHFGLQDPIRVVKLFDILN